MVPSSLLVSYGNLDTIFISCSRSTRAYNVWHAKEHAAWTCRCETRYSKIIGHVFWPHTRVLKVPLCTGRILALNLVDMAHRPLGNIHVTLYPNHHAPDLLYSSLTLSTCWQTHDWLFTRICVHMLRKWYSNAYKRVHARHPPLPTTKGLCYPRFLPRGT